MKRECDDKVFRYFKAEDLIPTEEADRHLFSWAGPKIRQAFLVGSALLILIGLPLAIAGLAGNSKACTGADDCSSDSSCCVTSSHPTCMDECTSTGVGDVSGHWKGLRAECTVVRHSAEPAASVSLLAR